MDRKRRKITNSGEMKDALVEDFFRMEELGEMEAEAIRHNVTGVRNGSVVYEQIETVPDVDELAELLDADDTENYEMESNEVPRFRIFSEEETEAFINENRNKNTSHKTKSDIKIIKDFFASINEFRDPADIPPSQLDSLLARFYLGARKRDHTEYEPSTLYSINNSLDRYIRDKELQFSIKKGPEFSHSRRVFDAKKKSLKAMGKGNKPNAAEPLNSEELSILREKRIIGNHNPKALLHLIWLINSIFFGLRGRQDHVNLLWGDIQLKKTSKGKEYLEFNERSTKTRSGSKVGDVRPVPPRAFADSEKENFCPVIIYKENRRHRPIDMCEEDSRFYVRPLPDPSGEVWYSKQTIGKDKLGKMMKEMAEDGNLVGGKVNHSGRKTFATALLQNGNPITEVAQLGDWKSVASLTHYSVPSAKQQEQASKTIYILLIPNESSTTDINDNDSVIDDNNVSVVDLIPVVDGKIPEGIPIANGGISQISGSKYGKMQSDVSEKKDLCLFQNAVINGGTININIVAGPNKKKNSSSQFLTSEILSSQSQE